MSALGVLSGLDPALVWERFGELTAIPRPPKEEAEVRAYVLARAGHLGLASAVDAEGNVLVRVPASTGRENAATVVLQSHLDMVCERDPGSDFDPREGRIRVVVDGDWVVAPETTLGADNGIGVAAALAVAEDSSLEHGPLELLFTVAEEQGLDGAKALEPSFVSGRVLVNLDGTTDEALTIGCAGALHTFTRVRLSPAQLSTGYVALGVALSGARGGHSGADIVRGRVNAIAALGRVLSRAREQAPFRLARLDGGVSRNAIPRAAEAVVALAPVTQALFRDGAERELQALREQYAGTDNGLTLEIEEVERGSAAGEQATARTLDLLATVPSGVVAMSPEVPGTVETSTSLTVAVTEAGVITLSSMTRSANPQALEEVVGRILAAARLAGAEVELLRSYAPWRPNLESQLLATARTTFERVHGGSPRLEIVHGGLECAVIADRLPGMDMVAIGPEIVGMHAPGERLNIPSTQRFYRLLTALLDDISAERR